MKHVTYMDTAKQIASGQWGKKHETDEDAQRDLLKSIDLSGACLLNIMNRLDGFLAALAEESMKGSFSKIITQRDEIIDFFVAQRSEDHGPCPPEVMRYLYDCLCQQAGHILFRGSIPTYLWSPQLPPKGTEARKAYDNWMRTKVKKPKPREQTKT
jgi:hypothetical protein